MSKARDRADRGGTTPIKIGTTILNIDREIKVTDYNKILKILKLKGLEKISINVKKK